MITWPAICAGGTRDAEALGLLIYPLEVSAAHRRAARSDRDFLASILPAADGGDLAKLDGAPRARCQRGDRGGDPTARRDRAWRQANRGHPRDSEICG